MAGSIYDWSVTAADNDDADTDINWIEGQPGNTVNNSARAMMAKLAGLVKALRGAYTTAGTSTAYTLAVDFEPSSLTKGWVGLVRFNQANGAAPTLAIGSLAATAIWMNDGAAPAVGEIAANSVHLVHYDANTSRIRILTSGASALTSSDISDFSTAVNAIITTIDEMATNTAPAVDDTLGTYDTSDLAQRQMRFDNFFKVISLLTQDTTPDISADSVVTYDNSATAAKRVLLKDFVNGFRKGSDIASAATLVIPTGGYYHVTGTTTITDIDFTDATDGRWAMLIFDAALTLTHNATTLPLPGGANITTAAGDMAFVFQDNGDNVKVFYQKANGSSVISSGGITSLGTITTTSGTSQTLSSLTLTNYKFLRLVCKAVSFGSIQSLLVGNSSGDAVAMTVSLANAARTFSGTIDIDLATGVFAACVADSSGASMINGGATSPLTTSSTAVYVSVSGGASFDAGSIIVYGIK